MKPVLVIVMAVVALAVPGLASAAIFNVDRTDDNAAASACTAAANDCSLRGAIIASNADPNTADTINVPAGTYSRSSAYPTIVGSVNVIGAGAATTVINANAQGRALFFQGPGLLDKTGLVSDVTIRGGSAPFGAGASVENYGTLTLRRVTVANNVAGDSGGGLVVNANDRLVVENSTITGNSTLIDGGGIWNNGGAFAGTVGSMTLTNVTISGNSAQAGAGVWNVGVATFSNVTLVDNSATSNGGNLKLTIKAITVKNTIVANGAPNNCFIDNNNPGSTVSAGHNLESADTCGFSHSSDSLDTDPMLGPLQDNGGPTFTHDLLPGSPAIDAGDNSGSPTTDQRGVPRPQNVIADIGAYEVDTATPIGSTVDVQPIDTNTGGTPVSLTFDTVTQGGNTSLTTGEQGELPPAGFKFSTNPPTYYNITTSATFNGKVTVCIHYSGVANESKLKLLHFENGQWINVTTSLDTGNDIICGEVTSLSPFAAFEDDGSTTDTTPDTFVFTDVINAQPNKIQTSNFVTITGINSPAPISVSGGEYQIERVTSVTAWTTAAGVINNGEKVRVRHLSAKPPTATTNTTLNVGGVSDTFSSRTVPKKSR
jgi:hypothetical protein